MLNGPLSITLSVLVFSLMGSAYAQPTNPPTVPAKPYNIILIINDQEAYKLAAAPGYELPARAALKQHGVTFQNHYTAAAMCSPSRATFLTGTPPQVNGVFDQMEYTFVPELSSAQANVGSILKKLGYRTAYFGKFEMDKNILIATKNTVNYSTLAQPYGFDVFNPSGDVGGNPLQGYQDDVLFASEAVHWLRKESDPAKKTAQPFFMVVSLLNPHDIMYGDANIPYTPAAQIPLPPLIFPPPDNSLYAHQWQFALPDSLQEKLSAPGMPPALTEYQTGWSQTLGFIPTDRKDMWTNYYNYYLNAIRDNDRTLQQLVDVLTELKMWDNTVVILTADHGEMGGAHGGLRGKGPMAYEENAHIPLIIAHPAGAHGVTCAALTSHLDLVPTIVGLTGLPPSTQNLTGLHLAGHDFSSLLKQPATTDLHAIRPGVLFNYVGISTTDASFLKNQLVTSFAHKPTPKLTEINLDKRGFLAFVFDGRYKFARYYAPNAFNVPKTLAQIFKYNDVQLFDLTADPHELHNLALDQQKNKALILQMNNLLNELMAKEVGINDGKFLPADIRPKNPPLTF